MCDYCELERDGSCKIITLLVWEEDGRKVYFCPECDEVVLIG
jgi:hypothetical protein